MLSVELFAGNVGGINGIIRQKLNDWARMWEIGK